MLVRPLTRPLVRPLTRRVTEPGFGWSPRALFANGEQGAWYDPSDLSSMNTKHDGSGAVPGVGDPVGYIADKSGRGNHAKQTTDTARPTLQLASGRYYLQFDGVDDFLVTSAIDFTGTDKMSVVVGCKADSATDGCYVGLGTDHTSAGFYLDLATASFQVSATPLAAREYRYFSPPPSSASHVTSVVINRSGADANLRIPVRRVDAVDDSGTPTTVGTGTSGVFGANPLHIGRRWGAADPIPFNGRIYSLLIRGAASTAAQIAAAERYAAAKTGVPLA